jgi:hypothetical protein
VADVIRPAERSDKLKNKENPELYAVFPFRLYGVGRKDSQVARETYAKRLHASHECWSQDDIQAACLGLSDEARPQRGATRRTGGKKAGIPAFLGFASRLGAGHGPRRRVAIGAAEHAHAVRGPADPVAARRGRASGSVIFRLHAPFRTVVEGRVRDGVVEALRVTPESRLYDIVIWQGAAESARQGFGSLELVLVGPVRAGVTPRGGADPRDHLVGVVLADRKC